MMAWILVSISGDVRLSKPDKVQGSAHESAWFEKDTSTPDLNCVSPVK